MIAKHVAMKSAQQGGFRGLVKYITDSQSKSERVGNVRVTNCHSDRVDQAVLEVLNTQAKNTRSTADKNYHLVISFAPGESPDAKILISIEERICAAIGFAAHQRISVTHHDTDSLHIHVAINKIHPQRYTIHEPYNAYHTLGQVCAKLEKEFGLQQVNHTTKKGRGENVADDMESHADVESLLGWIRRECSEAMRGAQDWQSMHALMRGHGLTIHIRANGLAISSDAGISVKASSVAREFSKASLEKKLGIFEPPVAQQRSSDSSQHYIKRPLRSHVDTSELYGQYKDKQQEATKTRAEEWAMARARKQERIEAAKRKGRLKRAAIKLLNMPGMEKKLLYAATSKTLLKEIAAINKEYLEERQEIYDRYKRGTWSDWLRDEAKAGDTEALAALRARSPASGLRGNTVRGTGKKCDSRAAREPDSITKSGTIIYHVGNSAVRDDGSKLKVSRGANNAGLEAALRIAIERYGDCITVTGSAEFKEQIARVAAAARLPVRFDDAALERRRRQLTQPLKPKEKQHDNDRTNPNGQHVGRRSGGSRNERDEPAGKLAKHNAVHAPVASGTRTRHTSDVQPDPGRTRPTTAPPPANRVRELPELGLVHVSDRSEVLLPGHVSGHLEHQGTKPDHRVRRRVRRPGRLKQPREAKAGRNNSQLNPKPGAHLFRPLPRARNNRTVRSRRQTAPPQTNHLQPLAQFGGEPTFQLPQATKPNVGKAGSSPPPASKDRLSPLSRLGDIAIRSGVPLSPSPPLPQPVSLPGSSTAGSPVAVESARPSSAVRAAEKYIIEREQKRRNGFDIPKHSRYNFAKEMSAAFAGIRRIDGQVLALLKIGDEVFVQPVDESTARSLKRMAIGQYITVKADGALKTKGRHR